MITLPFPSLLAAAFSVSWNCWVWRLRGLHHDYRSRLHLWILFIPLYMPHQHLEENVLMPLQNGNHFLAWLSCHNIQYQLPSSALPLVYPPDWNEQIFCFQFIGCLICIVQCSTSTVIAWSGKVFLWFKLDSCTEYLFWISLGVVFLNSYYFWSYRLQLGPWASREYVFGILKSRSIGNEFAPSHHRLQKVSKVLIQVYNQPVTNLLSRPTHIADSQDISRRGEKRSPQRYAWPCEQTSNTACGKALYKTL